MPQPQTVRPNAPHRLAPYQEEEGVLPTKGRDIRGRFHLGHHPNRWRWLPEWGFLPSLSQLAAVPGVNGVRRARGQHALTGDIDVTAMIAGFQGNGGWYIDPNDSRLGEYRGYDRHFYRTDAGRPTFVFPWQVPTILPGGRIKWNEAESIDAYNAFCGYLRDNGLVHELEYDVVLEMLERLRERRDQIQGRVGAAADSAFYKAKFAAIDAKIAGIEQAWAEHEGAAQAPAKTIAPQTLSPSALPGAE